MEINHPQSLHKFQRWRIKILKCMNFTRDKIQLKQGRNGITTKIYVGRHVSEEEIIKRITEQLSEANASIQVLRMRII